MSLLSDSLHGNVDKTSDILYSQIVEQIRLWICEGKVKEGDMLPSERELAKTFNVSRIPVREALKILEYLGVVEYIRGKGVRVKLIDIGQVLNNISFLITNPISHFKNIFEVREVIESQAAGFAALRRTQNDLDKMEESLLRMERSILRNDDVTDASIEFHNAVVEATHNEVMIKVNNFLKDLLRYSRQETLKDENRRCASLSHHKVIFKEIKQQNTAGAIEALRAHLAEIKQ